MAKLSHRVLQFAIRKLNAINNNIEAKQKQKIEQAWSSKFLNNGFFDHALEENITIRLYKDSVLSRLIFDGFESEELEFLKSYLKKGDTFLDIGANIGLFSLVASSRVGKQGQILAFEPSPNTFYRLKENIALNNITNVKLYNLGLSDKEDRLSLNISESGYDAWNSFANMNDGKFQNNVAVQVRKLDDIIREESISNVDLIKLDVEGWEKFVLYGGRDLLMSTAPVLMVEFTESNTFAAGYHVQELFDILEEWGYSWYRYKDGGLLPETKQLYYPYDNLFAIKSLEDAVKRIG